MKKYTRGFTLIELLVVIAIIGILASVVLVSLNTARSKGRDVRVLSETAQIRTVLEAGFNGTGYPDLAGGDANFAATSTDRLDIIVADIFDIQNATTSMGMLNLSTSDPANGIAIFTDTTSGIPTMYSIYSKLTQMGYFCVGSNGQTLTNTTDSALPVPTDNFDTCI